MKLNASDFADVMEQQLKAARLDLLEDVRLAAGANGGDAVVLGTLAHVIEDKMEVAARYGYEGIESSLRPEAQDALLAAGLDIESCRKSLDAAAACLRPGAVPRQSPGAPGPNPNAVAAAVLAGGAVVAILLYAVFRFHPLILMLLVAVSVVPAVMLRNARVARAAAARDRFLHEYPGELCRHYVQETASQIEEYEEVLNEALARAGEPAQTK